MNPRFRFAGLVLFCFLLLTSTAGASVTIAATSPKAGALGSSYSQAFTASGGTAPYTWSVTSGSLPPGLTLSSAGTISGAPTTAGLYTFALQVTDSTTATTSNAYTITIEPFQQTNYWAYTDLLVNGWQNWSYTGTFNFANTTPVHSGGDSISAILKGFGALYLHADNFDTTNYTSLSFWINGGTGGGQPLLVSGEINGTAQSATYPITPTANTWTQVTIPLSTLGVADNANFNGFIIKNNSNNTLTAFYVDDVELVATTTVPSTVHVNVNAASAVRTVDARMFGINTATWDGQLDTTTSISLLNAIKTQSLRFPGGSTADTYNWTVNQVGTSTQQTNFDKFAAVALGTNAQVFITVNYGSGTPTEAAAWVLYSNVTNHYGFKYWEVGNENYGVSWETDNNVLPHDPVTYATRFALYYAQMKAADPTIKVGAVIINGEDSYANYPNETVTNPRTGVAHSGWTPLLLSTLKTLGVMPDFLIYHKYGNADGDAELLQLASTWPSDVTGLRQQVTDYLGSSGTGIELVCTENNGPITSSTNIQGVSLVDGLYYADSMGEALQTEINARLWWDFHNGRGAEALDPTLYAWRAYQDDGMVYAPNSTTSSPYPTYYCAKLMQYFATGGDTVVTASSDYPLLSAYATKRANGSVSVMVINKHPTATLSGSIALTGFSPAAMAAVYSYGTTQDTAALTGIGSVDIAQSSISNAGSSFTYSFPPYSVTVLSLEPTLAITTAPTLPSVTANSTYTPQILAATGGTPSYTWVISSGTAPPGMTLNSSGMLSGTPTTAGTYNFSAQATDSSGNTVTQNFSIIIIPLPLLITTLPLLIDGNSGAAYSQTLAAAGGTPPYTWSLSSGTLPSGLTLSSAGVLSGTPTVPGLYSFTVQVADSAGQTNTETFALTIIPALLNITSTSPLASGMVNSAYAQTLAATGGTPGYTWSLNTGTLPPGLTLSSTGVLGGTPTTAGTYNFTVKIADGGSQTATLPVVLTISPALTVTTLSPLAAGTEFIAYAQTLAATGGTPLYTWSLSSGTLPPGLALTALGILTDIPTTVGTYNFTAQVTDSAGFTATQAYALTIAAPPLLVITSLSPLTSAIVNLPFAQTLAAIGGTPGYTWTLTAGALPSGLALSSSGALSGTPTATGTFNFTAHVADSEGQTATKAYALTIAQALGITTSSLLTTGTSGAAYSQILAAAGGVPTYAWSLTTGSLPPGVILSPSGTLSGTPTTAGTYNFTLQVVDILNDVTTRQFGLTITPALAITIAPTLTGGIVSGAYAQTLTATGGISGYTWSLATGALPPGLTLNPTGALNGTPTTAGTYNFTLQLIDGANHTVSQAFAVTIAPLLAITTGSNLASVVVQTSYSQTLAATGGTPGYTWSVSGGALPPGLTLSSDGILGGLPTTAGTYNFTAQVTDSLNVKTTLAFSLTVVLPLSVSNPSLLSGGTVNASYAQTLAATGGTPGYIWAISSGTLPPGLTLGSSGALTGTPTTAGTYNFIALVTDSANLTAIRAFNLTIVLPLAITNTSLLANGVFNSSYAQTLAANGGTPGYTWSVSTGSLPPGLALSSSGVLSGTPTAAGAYNFTVQVVDSLNLKTTLAVSLTVVLPLGITNTSTLVGGTLNSVYSQTLAATGGTPGYTWAISAGTLPPGLALSSSGVLTGTPTTAGTYNFTALVTDSANLTTSQVFTLTVVLPLAITNPSSLANGVFNASYAQTLSASGGTAGYTWSVSTGSLPPGLALSSSGVLSGTPTTAGSYNFTVQVADSLNLKTTLAVSITIVLPISITNLSSLSGGTVSASYAQTLAATGGTPSYIWTISSGTLPPGLTLGSSGALTGTPTTAGTYNFTTLVTDSANLTASRAFTLTVVLPLIITNTSLLSNGVSNSSYSQTLAASGGTPAYTWSVSAGSLPPGLALSSSGVLSGTPTAAGTYNFTVQVADNLNLKTTLAVSITIVLPISIANLSSLSGGTVSASYAQTLAATGGTPGYIWTISSGALPPGLTLGSSGALTGTPTTAGTYNFTALVTDSANLTAIRAFTLTVALPLVITNTPSLANGVFDASYSQTLAAGGGTPGYSWSISAGALPPGLALSSSGVLSGTPTGVGTYNFTVQVTDNLNVKTTLGVSLTVVLPLGITNTSTLVGGTLNTAYSQTLAASGGTPGYAWSVSAGSLPPGLALGSSGVLAGTPTATGTFNFTVQVADSLNLKTTLTVSLTVILPLSITNLPSLAGGTVNASYGQTLAATGGTPGYTWTINAGTLPPGLSLSSAGALTGTPTAAGTYNFTVQVTDSLNLTTTLPVSLTIAPPPLAITSAALLVNGTASSAYTQTLAAIGGTPGYTWTVSAGTLPPGLSLSSAGALSGTPTTAGTYNFTVKVTDSLNLTTTLAATLTIAPPPLAITSAALLVNGTASSAYTQTLAAIGGTPGYIWTVSAGTLPPGLSLSSAGALTGTPTAAGTYNFTVKVTDSLNLTTTLAATLTIAPPPLAITSAALLVNGTASSAYAQTLAAIGGTPGYIWTVSAGTLPLGLTFGSSGALTGTPTTAGTYNFTVKVTDSLNLTTSLSVTLTIAPPPLAITSAALLASGMASSSYAQTLAATGGTPGYIWSVSAGTLPPGLTLGSSGALSGTPTTAGTYNFTVEVADSLNLTTTLPVTLTIAPPPLAITSAAFLANGIVGSSYTQTLVVVGGLPAYTWTITSGAAPPGLTLSSSGALTGIPTALGTFNFIAQVADSSNETTTQAFSITIGNVPYSAWAAQYFTAAELADPAVSGMNAQAASDGLSNLLKYALNLNPKVAGPQNALTYTNVLDPTDNNTYLTFTYTRRLAPSGLTYIVETSSDLINWSSDSTHVTEVQVTDDGNGLTQTVTARALPNISTASSPLFIHLRVTQP